MPPVETAMQTRCDHPMRHALMELAELDAANAQGFRNYADRDAVAQRMHEVEAVLMLHGIDVDAEDLYSETLGWKV